MADSTVTEEWLLRHLITALQDAPATTAHMIAQESDLGPQRADAIVDADIGGAHVRLIIEVKKSAFPRDVREAIWQLRNYITHLPRAEAAAIPMVIAEAISPGAKALMREMEVGYYDTGGSLYVPAKGAFIYVDKPLPTRQARSLDAIFAGRRAQVLHAVWLSDDAWFGVHEIAKRALVSPTTASATLAALEKREWVVSKGAGPTKERRLADRRGLLDAWAAHQLSTRIPPTRHYYVAAPDVERIVNRLDHTAKELDALYAITGVAAAQNYAPFLSTVSRVQCRLSSSSAEAVLAALDARTVREGWNLGVIESKSAGELTFRQRIGDGWFADPLQTYLDLLQSGGRSKEMADHLRSERLGA